MELRRRRRVVHGIVSFKTANESIFGTVRCEVAVLEEVGEVSDRQVGVVLHCC